MALALLPRTKEAMEDQPSLQSKIPAYGRSRMGKDKVGAFARVNARPELSPILPPFGTNAGDPGECFENEPFRAIDGLWFVAMVARGTCLHPGPT